MRLKAWGFRNTVPNPKPPNLNPMFATEALNSIPFGLRMELRQIGSQASSGGVAWAQLGFRGTGWRLYLEGRGT